MPVCNNCGSHISSEYKRVMADDDGEVWKCPANDCVGRKGHDEHIKGRTTERPSL